MASSELLNISQRHPNFNDDTAARILSDIKRSDADTIKTKERYFKEQVVETTNSTVSFGNELVFTIKRSDGFVGGFFLELVDTDAGKHP